MNGDKQSGTAQRKQKRIDLRIIDDACLLSFRQDNPHPSIACLSLCRYGNFHQCKFQFFAKQRYRF
jgi:hypothetical protein